MEKSALIIETLEMSDEAIISLQHFFHELMLAFESHYYPRLRKNNCRQLSDSDTLDDLDNDQYPF